MELSPAESIGELVETETAATLEIETASDLPRLSPPGEGPGYGGQAIAVRAPNPATYYLIAGFVSLLVVAAPLLFAWSYERDLTPFRNDVFALCMVAVLAIGPAALVWLTAYILHQTAKMSAETRRAQAITDQLTLPTSLAARGAGSAVEQMRREIEHATAAAAAARNELLSLREVLASESERLVEAAEGSSRTATNLIRDLSAEREKMNILAGTLDAQASSVGEAITRHARMVAEASDLADAAGEASDAARVASEDLSRQVARLETASENVGGQVRLVEESLTEQRTALVSAADGLRGDHEAFAAQAETQLARLNEVVVHAHEGASEVSRTAANSAEALGALLGSARDQLAGIVDAATGEREQLVERSREALEGLLANTGDQLANIVDAAGHERDLLSASAAQSVGAISEIAARERQAMEEQVQATVDNILAAADQARLDIETKARALGDERERFAESAAQSLRANADLAAHEREQLQAQARETIDAVIEAAETARKAMESQAETARHKVDQLGEAAFAAGQRAEAVFDKRLSEAQNLIEQSAGLVDKAGAESLARIGDGVGTARATLGELENLLTDVDARIAKLPADAHARAEAVRASIERGMEELMASAPRAAEETQSIDAAFQDRVRRNYDMLSEAVRLMGVVAGAAGGGTASRTPAPARPAPLSEFRAEARAEPRYEPRTPEPRAPEPRAPEPRAAEPRASDAGLRPRLRLTPTASDEEFKQVFDSAGGREAPRRDAPSRESGETGPDGWTWKELLSSMEEEPIVDETHLADVVLAEIETMGIDAGALLPRSRIEEIAAAVVSNDHDGVRTIVRRLAPAAIRRVARRQDSDRVFRAQSERFALRYLELLDDAARRGGDGTVVSALLGSDQGRAFLLFDAALNDAG